MLFQFENLLRKAEIDNGDSLAKLKEFTEGEDRRFQYREITLAQELSRGNYQARAIRSSNLLEELN